MSGEQGQRKIIFDYDLGVEVYQLKGVIQAFPNHFHTYYVIGFVEGGKRRLHCKGQEYILEENDLILFNGRDNHACKPIEGVLLEYYAVNIDQDVMAQSVQELTGKCFIPAFAQNVIHHSAIAPIVRTLYDAILSKVSIVRKKHIFNTLLSMLLESYITVDRDVHAPIVNQQIQSLCHYMEKNYTINITLDELCTMTSFGKSYLIRSFTKQIGVSPYRYLQTIRLDKAKQLLSTGYPLADIAALTGFSDQSHFTNNFKEFIGLTPKQYQRIFIKNPSQKEYVHE